MEKYNYPEMIMEFPVETIAKCISSTCRNMHKIGESHRMCAIIIWSMTMNYQVIPLANRLAKETGIN